MQNQPLMQLILKGLALAMGVAAVVLSILNTASPQTLITLLGIGLFCLAAAALQNSNKG
jgi:hypothetical protein